MKRPNFLFLIVVSLLLSACGTGMSIHRSKARDQFLKGNFAAAEQEVINPEVIEETQNRLLTLLDLGTIAHYNADYVKSNFYFSRVKRVARELYTTSVREKIASGLLNDNAESYVGMDYELSLVHYYITMNFILISQADTIKAWGIPEIRTSKEVQIPAETHEAKTLNGRDRLKALGQARSELLAWNAFLSEVRSKNRGTPYYKDDLLNKVFAAYVHRMINNSRDRNIARILQKDAAAVLLKAYSSYPTFNGKSESFVNNYKQFSSLAPKTIHQRYLQETSFFKKTNLMIDSSAKNRRDRKGNLLYILEYGGIPIKREKSVVIGMSTLFKGIKDPALRRSLGELSTHLIINLAPEFGLAFVGAAVVGAATGTDADGGEPKYISEAVDSVVGFQFKIPHIQPQPTVHSFTIKFVRTSDNMTVNSPVGIMSPLNDIAHLNVDRRAASIAFKTGMRVGLKYLAALIPAIYTYKKINGPKFLKALAAAAVWGTGKKIVDATEAADLRSWGLLPKWIGLTEVNLPKGSYRIFAVGTKDGQSREVPLGELTIDGKRQKMVKKGRIFADNFIDTAGVTNVLN